LRKFKILFVFHSAYVNSNKCKPKPKSPNPQKTTNTTKCPGGTKTLTY